MRAAFEPLPQIMRNRQNISALAALQDKVQMRKRETFQFETGDANKARLSFDFLSLPRSFIERHATDLNRGKHRRHLILIADESLHRVQNLVLGEWRDRARLQYFTICILGISDFAEFNRALVLLVHTDQKLG